MNRRQFLLGATAIALVPVATLAAPVPVPKLSKVTFLDVTLGADDCIWISRDWHSGVWSVKWLQNGEGVEICRHDTEEQAINAARVFANYQAMLTT